MRDLDTLLSIGRFYSNSPVKRHCRQIVSTNILVLLMLHFIKLCGCGYFIGRDPDVIIFFVAVMHNRADL